MNIKNNITKIKQDTSLLRYFDIHDLHQFYCTSNKHKLEFPRMARGPAII